MLYWKTPILAQKETIMKVTEPVVISNGVLTNVHDPADCAGRACWVHTPSDHPLKDAPVLFRYDRGIIERTCPHGVGHPDPDDLAYRRSRGAEDTSVHGCDGCCRSER